MLKFRNKMCLAWPSWIQRFCNRRKIPNTSITRRSIQSYAAFIFLLRFDFFHWETSALFRIYIFSSSFPKIFWWPWEIYILTNFSSLWQHFSFFSFACVERRFTYNFTRSETFRILRNFSALLNSVRYSSAVVTCENFFSLAFNFHFRSSSKNPRLKMNLKNYRSETSHGLAQKIETLSFDGVTPLLVACWHKSLQRKSVLLHFIKIKSFVFPLFARFWF